MHVRAGTNKDGVCLERKHNTSPQFLDSTCRKGIQYSTKNNKWNVISCQTRTKISTSIKGISNIKSKEKQKVSFKNGIEGRGRSPLGRS